MVYENVRRKCEQWVNVIVFVLIELSSSCYVLSGQ